MRNVRFIVPFTGVLLLGLPAAARSADSTYWLILRDGQRLAATGALEVIGRSVRFRAPGGTLSALPLEQVDLAATRAVSSTPRQARNLALPSPEERAKSAVGLAGEAAKRAGRRGSFIDLTGIVVPQTPTVQPTPTGAPAPVPERTPNKARAAQRGASPKTGRLDDPQKLLRLRLRRLPRPPS